MKRENPKIAIPTDPELRRLFPVVGADFVEQCDRVKWYLIDPRDGFCWVEMFKQPTYAFCVGASVSSKHEGPVRRGDVMGWPKPWRVLIHVPYNCFMLCDEHHGTSYEPGREQFADWLLGYYGDPYVAWLASLPFKLGTNPMKGWLERHGVYV